MCIRDSHYIDKCRSENKQPVKVKYYYHAFLTKFNLNFKIPSKDNCQKWDKFLTYNMKLTSRGFKELACILLEKVTARIVRTWDDKQKDYSLFCFLHRSEQEHYNEPHPSRVSATSRHRYYNKWPWFMVFGHSFLHSDIQVLFNWKDEQTWK